MNIQQIATDIAAIKESLVSNKRVMSFPEAAAYLGLSRSYLYKMTSSGVVPFSKPSGKKLYFDREKLDEWLLSNSNSSQDEKERKAATYITTQSNV